MFTEMMSIKTSTPVNKLLGLIGIIPKKRWILNWEREAIIGYARTHMGEGYRRLTYMMIDDNIAAVCPSTTYRVLKSAGFASSIRLWRSIRILSM
jgi:hypothetical protein